MNNEHLFGQEYKVLDCNYCLVVWVLTDNLK